jgi:hypothetical protein
LLKVCPRCGAKSADPSNPQGRCSACLKKLKAAKKTPGSWQRAQTKADDALRRQKGKNGTAHKKSSGLGSRKSIVKQVKTAEKKTGQKLSPDRVKNSKGYAASNTRMVPEKLNRGRHTVDPKKLAAWHKNLKKTSDSITHNESLQKEQEARIDANSPLNPLHGWIDPSGHYHHLGSLDVHNTFLRQLFAPETMTGQSDDGEYDTSSHTKDGWIAVGGGGGYAVHGHKDILHNPDHPATRAVRALVGKHWGGGNCEVATYGDPKPGQLSYDDDNLAVHRNLDAALFAKHGLNAAVKRANLYKTISSEKLATWRGKLKKHELSTDDFLTLLRSYIAPHLTPEQDQVFTDQYLPLIKSMLDS